MRVGGTRGLAMTTLLAACEAGEPSGGGVCSDRPVTHVLLAGQSLSLGQASEVVSTMQPYDNLSFPDGVRAGSDRLQGFVPLVERQEGNLGETIASGMANLLTELTGTPQDAGPQVLVSAHGVGGTPYVGLARGTESYERGIAHAVAGADIAEACQTPYTVAAVALIHGEADHRDGNTAYADDLEQWQADYEADLQQELDRSDPIPMFLCQVSSWTNYGDATSLIPTAQLEASRLAPQRLVLVTPKYFLPYADKVHLTGDGERWLGEHYAKVMERVLVREEPWAPLSPLRVGRSGGVVDIEFHVPVPPLVLDTDVVSDPGNYGFEYIDEGSDRPVIESVELTGPATVRVTLSREPGAPGRRIRYAFTGTPGESSGPSTGARGNLRDSDDAPSRHGYPLFNWSVTFDEPVP